jgi:hypothetical protein
MTTKNKNEGNGKRQEQQQRQQLAWGDFASHPSQRREGWGTRAFWAGSMTMKNNGKARALVFGGFFFDVVDD